MKRDLTKEWIEECAHVMLMTQVTTRLKNKLNTALTLDEGTLAVRVAARSLKQFGGRVILLGNGGAAASASHLAVDWALAGLPAVSLNDPAALTSHGNDFGIEAIFSKQLELMNSKSPDVIIAMSGSGKSRNVLAAIKFARAHGMGIVTMTGYEPDNEMRASGDINFWSPSTEMGYVQMAQLGLLHTICDFERAAA